MSCSSFMCNSSPNFLHILQLLDSPQMFQLAAFFLCVPAQLLISQVDSHCNFWVNILSVLCAVYGEHREQQNVCNKPAGWTVDPYQVMPGKCWKSDKEKSFLLRESWLRVESWKSWCTRLLNLKMRDIMVSRWFGSREILQESYICLTLHQKNFTKLWNYLI